MFADNIGRYAISKFNYVAGNVYNIDYCAIGFPSILSTNYIVNGLWYSQAVNSNSYPSITEYSYAKKSENGKSIYWYNTYQAEKQFNLSNTKYNYVALG